VLTVQVVSIHDESKRHQMVKELDALVSIHRLSPHLVSFWGAYFLDGAVVFALEYMDRGSLQDVVC
jgi:hypothetical protein